MWNYLFPRADLNHYCAPELLEGDLSGRVILITGATSGFGKVVAEQLISQGAHIIMASRGAELGKQVAAALTASGPGKAEYHKLDLGSFASVRAFADHIISTVPRLDTIIENAAVCCVPEGELEGYETHLTINHYGPFLLRRLLEPLLVASAPSRVIVVASCLHDRSPTGVSVELSLTDPAGRAGAPAYTGWMFYSRSKLANVLSAMEAGRQLAGLGVKVVSVHPGLDTTTGLFQNTPVGARIMTLFGRALGVQTTWQAVQTALHCTLVDAAELVPGGYYSQASLTYGSCFYVLFPGMQKHCLRPGFPRPPLFHSFPRLLTPSPAVCSSQWVKNGYRDGSLGGWPTKSPNPAVTPEAAETFYALSEKAVGLA